MSEEFTRDGRVLRERFGRVFETEYRIIGDQVCRGPQEAPIVCKHIYQDEAGLFFVQRAAPWQHMGAQITEILLVPTRRTIED